MSLAVHNIGYTWLLEEEYVKAENYFRNALSKKLKLKRSQKNDLSIFTSYLDLGHVLFLKQQYKAALFEWEKALDLDVDVSNDPELFIIHNWLQQTYMLFDVARAESHRKRFNTFSNAFNQTKIDLQQELVSQVFKLNLAEQELSEAHSDEVAAQEKRHSSTLLSIGIALIFAIAVWFVVRKLLHLRYYRKMHQIGSGKH